MLSCVVFALLDMAKNRLEEIVHQGNTAVTPLGGQLRKRPWTDEHGCVREYVNVHKVQCRLGSSELEDFRNAPRPFRHSAPFPEPRETMPFQTLTSNPDRHAASLVLLRLLGGRGYRFELESDEHILRHRAVLFRPIETDIRSLEPALAVDNSDR